jgi:hypothetical protein
MKAVSSCAALLCLLLLPAHAQVGFVQVAITNGYNFLGNPLNASDTNGVLNNSITNVLASGNASPAIPAGAAVYLWNTSSQAFGAPSIYSSATGWSLSYDLPPGKGFALYSPSAWTLFFVGGVVSGLSTNTLPGTNKFALVASKVAISGDFSSTSLSLPATDGQNVYLFRTNSQAFSDAFTYFNGYGWFDPDGLSGTNGPVVFVAQSFFVQHPGPDLNWVQNYSGPVAPPPANTSSIIAGARLQSMTLNAQSVALRVVNSAGNTYSVSFSTDGSSWKTLANNQTASIWTGPNPGVSHGYYRVTTP